MQQSLHIFKLFSIIKIFLSEIYNKKDLIVSLSIRNFKGRHFGSVFGMVWVIVEPLVYVFLLWFFFTKALKVQPSGEYPYVAWLMTSMILWNYFSSAFSSSVGTFKSHAYLLRKPKFNISILPVVSILSSFYVHLIFVGILLMLFFISHVPCTIFWFQAPYYLFATSILLLGLAWITASISLFIKDIENVVGVVLQIGFWISPIFWDLKTYPSKYRFLLELNPLTYVLEGYRKSFLYGEPFWRDLRGFLFFWSFTIIVLGIGMVTYKKLRPHFGDVI